MLFLFLDGVGLGNASAQYNPFMQVELPHLQALAGGYWLAERSRWSGERASFVPTDAGLGVAGKPQSATGQATLLTGQNIPQQLGYHWGPKPNAEIVHILQSDNLFMRLTRAGQTVRMANAYPQAYFDNIARGRRNYSAIPLALTAAGVPLPTTADLLAGTAFSADFTGQAWRAELGVPDAPLLTPQVAGVQLAKSAQQGGLLFFECWLTDYLGHRGTLSEAVQFLQVLDGVVAGLLEAWDDAHGLLVITADHGNLEDLSHKHHTENAVPTLLLGKHHAQFAQTVHDLADIASVVSQSLLELPSTN
ncbi:MAG TPA: hypothetical protein PK299_15455 [Anaerolineales bacterium]|nr:hypothetical protein [Anaerolineales bacterium]